MNSKWKKQLHNGDEITIDSGDNELPPSVIIAEIEYCSNGRVRIVDTDGQKYDCTLNEIT